MQGLKDSENHYYNYKGTHSIVLLAIADVEYKFMYVDVRCNGTVSDWEDFQSSSLSKGLKETLSCVFIW